MGVYIMWGGIFWGWLAGTIVGGLLCAIPILTPFAWLIVPSCGILGQIIGGCVGSNSDNHERTQDKIDSLKWEVSDLKKEVKELKNNNTKYLKSKMPSNESIDIEKEYSDRIVSIREQKSRKDSDILVRPRRNSAPVNTNIERDRSRSLSPSNGRK